MALLAFLLNGIKNCNENYRITNRAAIYFDFNEPIITNEVAFRVAETLVGTHEAPSANGSWMPKLKISPNSTTKDISIVFDERSGTQRYELYNQQGQRVKQGELGFSTTLLQLTLASLPVSVYLLKISGDRSFQVGKIVLVKALD